MSGESSKIDESSPPPYTESKDTRDIKQPEPDSKSPTEETSISLARAALIETTGTLPTYFIFGPKGEFYFTNYEELYCRGTAASVCSDIVPYSIALSDAPEYGYFVAGATKANSVKWACQRRPVTRSLLSKAVRKHTEDEAAEQKWNKWFNQSPSTHSEGVGTVVAFGPGRSFYAASKSARSWHGIPAQMVSQIEQRWASSSTTPRHVTLGCKDTYALIWRDGTIDYHLGNSYPGLAKQLSDPSRKGVSFLSLNPFSPNDFYVEYADGNILYDITSLDPQARERIKLYRNATMQKRAKADGVTWTVNVQLGNGKEIITVSPETNHTFDLAATREKIKEQNATRLLADAANAKKKSSDAKNLAVAAVAIAACTIM